MRTGCHCLISPSVCVSVSVHVTFVVFTDCESCTRPISTNPGSMEASEYGLTHGTCFVARRLEVVTVAALVWISWCGLGVGRIFSSFFQFLFFFERTRPATSMRPPYFICLSSRNEARPKKRSNRGRSLPKGKKASSYRGAYRVPLLYVNSLSVCPCV